MVTPKVESRYDRRWNYPNKYSNIHRIEKKNNWVFLFHYQATIAEWTANSTGYSQCCEKRPVQSDGELGISRSLFCVVGYYVAQEFDYLVDVVDHVCPVVMTELVLTNLSKVSLPWCNLTISRNMYSALLSLRWYKNLVFQVECFYSWCISFTCSF